VALAGQRDRSCRRRRRNQAFLTILRTRLVSCSRRVFERMRRDFPQSSTGIECQD
jgi:hypothetical protein